MIILLVHILTPASVINPNFQVQTMKQHLPSLVLVNTSRLTDKASYSKFTFSCQPDISVYSKETNHKFENNLSLVEFPIEFKTTVDQDPFVVNPVPSSDTHPTTKYPFMSTTSQGCLTAGQITAYATSILSAQYRTHIFFVLILKPFARLIRWDRGGAVVTAPIYYDQEPHLFDFFIRYDAATRDVRGHDLTVRFPTDGESQRARELSDLADAKSLLTITIPDPDQSQESSTYVIRGPSARPDIPTGRWTRTSIAYDVQRNMRVLLKDSWRVLLEDITPEGEVYARLHQHSVPNIPYCSRATDVGDDFYHTSRTHEFVGKCGEPHAPIQIVPHRHYRLVLDTIGRKLETFECSHDLLKAVCASLVGELAERSQLGKVNLTQLHTAHEAAYKAGILHRDISVGNIMIFDSKQHNINGGMLIDWDLSKVHDPLVERSSARQYTRTVSKAHD
jgi:hypothetical protein